MWKRIVQLVLGFFGLLSGAERKTPKALLEEERENLRKQISRFNEHLAPLAGFCERLLRQVKSLEEKEGHLASQAAAHLRAGKTAEAGQYALQLRTVKDELEENRSQLDEAEKTYKNLEKTRDLCIAETGARIEQLSRLVKETELYEARAEIQELTSAMASSRGSAGGTLSQVEEYLNERRNLAAGKARMAEASLESTRMEIKKEEQELLALQALEEFADSYGLEMPGGGGEGEPPPAGRNSGPAEKN